jgi:hypothetical protein
VGYMIAQDCERSVPFFLLRIFVGRLDDFAELIVGIQVAVLATVAKALLQNAQQRLIPNRAACLAKNYLMPMASIRRNTSS